MPESLEQLDLPFTIDPRDLQTFLAQWCALEQAEDGIREDKRLLREEYATALPLRGLTTAIKVVRARQKLEQHAKEPMPLAHQGLLEAMVETYLAGQAAGVPYVPAL